MNLQLSTAGRHLKIVLYALRELKQKFFSRGSHTFATDLVNVVKHTGAIRRIYYPILLGVAAQNRLSQLNNTQTVHQTGRPQI